MADVASFFSPANLATGGIGFFATLIQQMQANSANAINQAINEGNVRRAEQLYRQFTSLMDEFGPALQDYMGSNIAAGAGAQADLWGRGLGQGVNNLATTLFGAPIQTPAAPSQAMNWRSLLQAATTPMMKAAETGSSQYNPETDPYPRQYLSPEEIAYIDQEKKPNLWGKPGRFQGWSEAEIDRWLWEGRGERVPKAAAASPATASAPQDLESAFWNYLGVTDADTSKITATRLDDGKGEIGTWRIGDRVYSGVSEADAKMFSLAEQNVGPIFGADANTLDRTLSMPDEGWLSGWAGRFKAGMAELDKLGETARGDIAETFRNVRGRGHQELLNRGISPLNPLMEISAGAQESEELAKLDEILARERLNWGSQLSGDFLNALTSGLSDLSGYDTSMGQNTLNYFTGMWPQVLNQTSNYLNQYSQTGMNFLNMLNNTYQQGAVQGPNPPNWASDWMLPWWQNWQARQAAQQAYQASKPSFWDYAAGPFGNLGGAAAGAGFGALFN